MRYLFEYNWMIRSRWINWCKGIAPEELFLKRAGGHNSFIQNLFHIIDVEQRWYARLAARAIVRLNFEDYNSLLLLQSLSDKSIAQLRPFVEENRDETQQVIFESKDRSVRMVCTHGEVLRHMIVHEVHHIGQLSVWAREISKEPISANFIGESLM